MWIHQYLTAQNSAERKQAGEDLLLLYTDGSREQLQYSRYSGEIFFSVMLLLETTVLSYSMLNYLSIDV